MLQKLVPALLGQIFHLCFLGGADHQDADKAVTQSVVKGDFVTIPHARERFRLGLLLKENILQAMNEELIVVLTCGMRGQQVSLSL
jgi:hypothetical protein